MNDEFYDDLWGPSEKEAPVAVKRMNSVTMAREFEKKLFNSKWCNGFAAVNVAALSSQIAKWKKAGQTEDHVRTLINTYMADPTVRGANPGWKDFVMRAEQIAAKVLQPEAVKPKDRYDLLEEAYELGTLEAFQAAFPGNSSEAQRQFDLYVS